MIIIELIFKACLFIIHCVLRFPYWLITARDCKHCKHVRYFMISEEQTCDKDANDEDECLCSITRKHFERESVWKKNK